MKHIALAAVLTALTWGVVSCEKENNPSVSIQEENNPSVSIPENDEEKPSVSIPEKKELNLTSKSAEFADMGNDFAFPFIDRVNDAEEGDYFISPLSMQFLLGMILDGAQGATASEICNVLGYGSGETDAVNEYCRSMMEQLPELDSLTKLSIANAIVVNQHYSLLDSYKSIVSSFYDAEVASKDFSDNDGTTHYINQWCADHTEGLITEVLKKDDVDESMFAFLFNAMYFKSQWMNKFDPACTSSEVFTTDGGIKKDVSMMKVTRMLDYRENDLYRAVRLPYGNGAYSMSVILPAEGKNLSDVTKHLNGKVWADFDSGMNRHEVNLWLPKFTTKFHIKLNKILSAMGMPRAFGGGADFSAMANVPLYLSFVNQDAVIKVDEEGTEAAAVSTAGMKDTSAGPEQDIIVFHADHPFLYLITESSTGAVLFAGRYCGVTK